jgi:hypothetical protein
MWNLSLGYWPPSGSVGRFFGRVAHVSEIIGCPRLCTLSYLKGFIYFQVVFFLGNQFHYPLHGEKARFGLKAAARPVSNSGEE